MRLALTSLFVSLLVMKGSLAAQDAAFDVASVRPNVSADAAGGINPGLNGRLTAINGATADDHPAGLRLHDSQLRGVPEWTARHGPGTRDR